MANVVDQDQFAYITQLDIEESETYTCVMQGSNIAEWTRAMKKELD